MVKIRTKELFIKDLPILTFLNFTLIYPHISNFIYYTVLDYLCFSSFYDLSIKKYNEDIFTIKLLNKYSKELANLASMSNKFNIYTSYDLLLETELYHKETNIIFNNSLPNIVDKKYFNIPTYTITGDIEPVNNIKGYKSTMIANIPTNECDLFVDEKSLKPFSFKELVESKTVKIKSLIKK